METHTQRHVPSPSSKSWRRAALAAVVVAGLALGMLAVSAGRVNSAPLTERWTADADTYVIQEYPNSSPGSDAKISAARWSNWHTKAYVRFRVDELRADQPVASVRVAFTFQRTSSQPSVTELRAVPSNSWPEADTSYADRPPTGDIVATAGDPGGATTVQFDVTRHVRAAGDYSFAVVNRSSDSAFVAYAREHGSDGPRLIVEYGTSPTASPTASPTVTGGPSPTGSPTPTRTPSPTGSPTASPRFLCGAAFKPESDGETYQDALAREDRLLGGLDTARVYYTGLPKHWPGKLDTDGRPMIVSFKLKPGDILAGTHDTHLRRWFAEAPVARDTYWVYYHEPEDNIARGEFSAADYRAAWRHLAALADAAGNPRLRATLVLMGYSVEAPSKRNWRDYYPGRDVVDVLAWDIYNYVNEGAGGYRDPAVLFAKAAETTHAEGLPFAVAEVGSAIADGDDGSGRARWLRDTLTYLRNQRAVFVSYFDMYVDHNHGPQHYELRDAASKAAYREACTP